MTQETKKQNLHERENLGYGIDVIAKWAFNWNMTKGVANYNDSTKAQTTDGDKVGLQSGRSALRRGWYGADTASAS
jgi:hypothetical protein